MKKIQEEYMYDHSKYKLLVWDYNLSPQDFFSILSGHKSVQDGWLDRNWATARVLENVNYYDALNLVDLYYLESNWSNILPKIYNKAIKDGYNYVLRKRTLSATR